MELMLQFNAFFIDANDMLLGSFVFFTFIIAYIESHFYLDMMRL